MLKRFLLLVVTIPTLLGFTSKIVACQWELNPKVLLITSYENAHEQSTEDKIIYQKLRSIYGKNVVTAVFSHEDDNTYANILINLINKFNLEKVFILDPSFIEYLPKTSSDKIFNSNLIRVLQYFTDVDFFFFNNQIADNIKITNNIYEFRFDSPNKDETNSYITYGASIAEHFYNQLVDDKGEIDTNKYNFETDSTDNNKWVVKIGILYNVGSAYHNKIIQDFVLGLIDNVPVNTKYLFYPIDLKLINSYNSDNASLVQQAASILYQHENVNFIFNSNYWYNNAIAYAASSSASIAKITKTIKFIASSVENKNDYKYQDVNYMLFSYNLDLEILDYTINNSFPEKYQVLDNAREKFHSYGLNNNLDFVDG